jgi:putative ABC transport system substrate-binding protein
MVTKTATDQESLMEALTSLGKVDLIWVVPDKSLVNSPEVFRKLLREANSRSIPVLAYHEAFVKEGALFSVSSDFTLMGKQAAEMMQNLINREAIATLPTVSPSLSKLAVNLSAAKRLNLELNPNVVSSASIVYK